MRLIAEIAVSALSSTRPTGLSKRGRNPAKADDDPDCLRWCKNFCIGLIMEIDTAASDACFSQ